MAPERGRNGGAASGSEAARIGNSLSAHAFHSRYSPLREAQRHVDAVIGDKRPSLVFIIGGGLNYLGRALADRLPNTRRALLQPCDEFDGIEVDSPDLRWSPGCGSPLEAIVSRAMADGHAAGGIAVIDWPPVASRYGAETARIRKAVMEALEAASADSATGAFWARRWLRNCVRFASNAATWASIQAGTAPIVIACAGPGLSDVIGELAASRGGVALWALASAHEALAAKGLEPDLVIATDPGFWNGAHLRLTALGPAPLAMAPSAYAPSAALRGSTIVPIDTGLAFERAALRAIGFEGTPADASGSSAGTALSLALRSTSGPVFLAGYDLASLDLSDHARPYAFDMLDRLADSRLRPWLSARSARVLESFPTGAGRWRLSRAFDTYARSIRPPAADAERAYRLSSSPVETPIRRGSIAMLSPSANGPGSMPVVVPFARTTKLDGESQGRGAKIRAMLDGIVDGAMSESAAAIEARRPIAFDAAMALKALAPRDSAALIALAARGDARLADLDDIRIIALRSAAGLAQGALC